MGVKVGEWEHVAHAYYRLAEGYRRQGNIDQADYFFRLGLETTKEELEKDYFCTGQFYKGLAEVASARNNFREALDYAKLATEIISRNICFSEQLMEKFNYDTDINTAILGIYHVTGKIYEKIGYLDSAIIFFNKANEINYQLGIPDQDAIFTNNQRLALNLMRKRDFKMAKKIASQSLDSLSYYKETDRKLKNSFYLNFYFILGLIHQKQGNYKEAIYYLNLSNTDVDASSEYYLGEIYLEMEDFDVAREYFAIALAHYRKNARYQFGKLSKTYMNLGIIKRKTGAYQAGLDYYQKAEEALLIFPTEEFFFSTMYHDYQMRILLERALIYMDLEEFGLANDVLQKSLDHARKMEGISSLWGQGEVYLNYGKLAHLQGDFALGLSYLNAGIDELEKFTRNGNSLFLGDFSVYFQLLSEKARLYYAWYLKDKNMDHLTLSIQNYEQAFDFADLIKRDHHDEEVKINVLKESSQITAEAVENMLLYFEVSRDSAFLQRAFTMIDRNKASTLLESVNELANYNYAGIPQELIEQENSLKTDIAYYERRIFELEAQKDEKNLLNGDSTIFQWTNKLTELKSDYAQLKSRIEKEYPNYAQLKYRLSSISIREVQQELLEPGETMLEYLVGDSQIYAVIIQKYHYEIKVLPRSDSLELWVENLREGIYGYWLAPDKSDSLFNETTRLYARSGYQLYESIFAPLFPNNELPPKLTVVPDGILGYIPFEVLLTQNPADQTYFNQYPYLLKKSQISYAFSATLLREMEAKHLEWKNAQILALAPSFSSGKKHFASTRDFREDNFSPLLYSAEEVGFLRERFDGEVWIGEAATRESFVRQAGEYRFIHLATHSKIIDDQPKLSRIAFTQLSDTIEEPDFLTIGEIYNLNLNAEMVVLSACETGIGKLYQGEGIMSMARAFAYSGTKSIITSLWSVDDQATSKIMQGFYDNLAKGETKDAALRKAKLDYLNLHDHRASHPFFWAAFVGVGDMGSVALKSGDLHLWIWVVLLSVLGMSLVGYFYHNKKRINY